MQAAEAAVPVASRQHLRRVQLHHRQLRVETVTAATAQVAETAATAQVAEEATTAATEQTAAAAAKAKDRVDSTRQEPEAKRPEWVLVRAEGEADWRQGAAANSHAAATTSCDHSRASNPGIGN